MDCFNCNKVGIIPEKRQFRCAVNFKLIATYTDEVIPHLTKTIVDDKACEEHSEVKKEMVCFRCKSKDISSYSESPEDKPHIIRTHFTCNCCGHYWYEDD